MNDFTSPSIGDNFTTPLMQQPPKLALSYADIVNLCGDIKLSCADCLSRNGDKRCAGYGARSGVVCSDGDPVCDNFNM